MGENRNKRAELGKRGKISWTDELEQKSTGKMYSQKLNKYIYVQKRA